MSWRRAAFLVKDRMLNSPRMMNLLRLCFMLKLADVARRASCVVHVINPPGSTTESQRDSAGGGWDRWKQVAAVALSLINADESALLQVKDWMKSLSGRSRQVRGWARHTTGSRWLKLVQSLSHIHGSVFSFGSLVRAESHYNIAKVHSDAEIREQRLRKSVIKTREQPQLLAPAPAALATSHFNNWVIMVTCPEMFSILKTELN